MQKRFLKNNQLPIRSPQSGFTLLEVIIALAIMALAFASILAVESGSINASARAKQMNIVGMLARNMMIETEYKIQNKTFDEIQKVEEGNFKEPYQDFHWKTEITEMKFPPLGQALFGGSKSSDGGGGGASDSLSNNGQNQATDLLTKLITNFLSKAIRSVKVTISWKRGKGTQTFSLTEFWVNLNASFNLSE